MNRYEQQPKTKGGAMTRKITGIEWVLAEVGKLVSQHPHAIVDVRRGSAIMAPAAWTCAYVTVGQTVHYLDDATGEQIHDTWQAGN